VAEARRAAVACTVVASMLAAAAASAQLPLPEQQPETRTAPARIVFSAAGDIHTIAADGSDRRRLTTTGPGASDRDPAWSPDGATIAFNRFDSTSSGGAIWLVNRDGGELRPLTPGAPRGTEQTGPSWSPDGRRIAFTRLVERGDKEVAELVTIAVDGSDERVVHSEAKSIEESVYFLSPAWSPSGDRIMFGRDVLGGSAGDDFRPTLHVVPAAGGQARRIVTNGWHGTWSPNGDRIAYVSVYERTRPCGRDCAGMGEIFVANADGSGRVRLTTSLAEDTAPSWSGDGLRIAFDSDRNSTQAEDEGAPPEVYSMRADGSCLTWLTNGTAHSQAPDFERAAGLSSDSGGCGAVPREPLVETDTSAAAARRPFPVWWLGPVAPNGLLLTDVQAKRGEVWFGYHDCGRFDPEECGDFVNVTSRDLCGRGRQLATAGRPSTRLSLARGALLSETHGGESGRFELYTHRSRVVMDTASGFATGRGLIDGLRQFGREDATAGKLPSTRLPVSFWRELRKRAGVPRREADRRRAVARRLAQLGVSRRLGCKG
jgi:Tol biopolymer transport system component